VFWIILITVLTLPTSTRKIQMEMVLGMFVTHALVFHPTL